jgi:hypothetical protein
MLSKYCIEDISPIQIYPKDIAEIAVNAQISGSCFTMCRPLVGLLQQNNIKSIPNYPIFTTNSLCLYDILNIPFKNTYGYWYNWFNQFQ